MAAINLGLYTYTVKLAYAVDEVVTARSVPLSSDRTRGGDPRSSSTSRGPVGVRVTGSPGRVSSVSSSRCAGCSNSSPSLRTLKRFSDSRPAVADELAKLNETDKAGYLLALLDVAETPWAKARAEMEFDQVMQDSIDGLQHQAEQDEMRTYRWVQEGARLPARRVRRVTGRRAEADPGGTVAEVAGERRGPEEALFGFLVGSTRGDAAYVMSDDYLGHSSTSPPPRPRA